jgi:alpha-1,2-mannosyltransferase
VIFVGIPFTRFALGRAVLLWLLLELLCVAVASALMLKAVAGRVSLVGVSVLVLVWLAWHPFEREMFWGQLMIVTLTLVCGAWVALRAQREMLGGVLLGVALALKLFGWPIVLFLLLTRRWRAFFSAVIAFALLHLAAALVIGFSDIVAYYRVVGPSVSKLYREFAGNFSVWTIGTRVFGVSWTDWYNPLVHVPSIAPVVSVVAVVCVLILTIRGALHTRSFDSAFCALTCVSTVLNPIAWSHYLVLTAPALCLVAWRIKPGGFTRRTIIVAGALVVLGLLVEIVLPAIMWLSPRVPGAPPVPFLVSTISFLPLVFVLLLTRVTLNDSMPVES